MYYVMFVKSKYNFQGFKNQPKANNNKNMLIS